MLLIPAIDLREGKCVRLRQGRMGEETVFSNDPLAVAERWISAGAKRLHIVDLDGAVSGKPAHAETISRIATTFPDISIQVGGGIRDEDTIQEYLLSGVRYVIIGTRAVNAPHFVADICSEFPDRILVGLDVKDKKVATDGWSKLSYHKIEDLAEQFAEVGVGAIIYTDISRDGMMQGVNVASTLALAQQITIPVIAAGGVSSLADIEALCRAGNGAIAGAITGRAIYEGTLDFAQATKRIDALRGENTWDLLNG